MQVAKLGQGSWGRRAMVIGGLTLLALIAAGWYGVTLQQRERQTVVAERGADVMPFDLDRTTHIFQNTPDGGLQQVVADDPLDVAQIALIRTHLQEEAAKFERGDFGDPASIHGQMMPGLSALRQGYAQITVTYGKLPDGAQLRYTTPDPGMATALHTWFAAQLSDHGGHALDHRGNESMQQ